MAKYLHRIGAKSIKFDLDVTIHYLKLNNTLPSLLKIRVHRGKDKVEETQPMQYSSSHKSVNFDYPLSFNITMYKKSGKYSKKDLLIKVLEIKGLTEILIGTFTVEFHKLAESGKSINYEEFSLYECKDPKARLCISVNLAEKGKNKNQFATGNLKNNSNNLPPRAASVDGLNYMKEPEKVETKTSSASFDEDLDMKTRKGSVKNVRSAFAISEDLLNEINETTVKEKVNEKNKEVASTFAFKADIIEIEEPSILNEKVEDFNQVTENQPENHEIEEIEEKPEEKIPVYLSESSSSSEEKDEKNRFDHQDDQSFKEKLENEEEKNNQDDFEFLKCANLEIDEENVAQDVSVDSSSSEEVPEEVLVIQDLPMPIRDMNETQPNAASQEMRLNLKEKEAGLPESRNTTCCAKCVIF
jgi:hypothetical protein